MSSLILHRKLSYPRCLISFCLVSFHIRCVVCHSASYVFISALPPVILPSNLSYPPCLLSFCLRRQLSSLNFVYFFVQTKYMCCFTFFPIPVGGRPAIRRLCGLRLQNLVAINLGSLFQPSKTRIAVRIELESGARICELC